MYFSCLEDITVWGHKTLPTIFDDSLSYLESVYRLKTIVKEMIEAVNLLTSSNKELTDKYKELVIKIEGLQKTIDDIINGNIIQPGTITLEMLAEDVKEMLKEVVSDTIYEVAKFVWFGLTDDGYFMAVIPDNWKDIDFDTTPDGELVLRY